MSKKGNLIIVAAPSGAGKTSLVNALVDSLSEIKISVSYTTRTPRPNDQEGKDYFFVSKEQFSQMVEAQAFLEHAIVYGHDYGTSYKWVMEQLAGGQDIILEIDWQGAKQVVLQFPQAITIYILPPSLAVLKQRLMQRQQDSDAVILARMDQAQCEMSHYHEFQYCIVNDDFSTALEQLRHIILAARLRLPSVLPALTSLLADLLKKQ